MYSTVHIVLPSFALTCQDMDSTRPLKVCCPNWHGVLQIVRRTLHRPDLLYLRTLKATLPQKHLKSRLCCPAERAQTSGNIISIYESAQSAAILSYLLRVKVTSTWMAGPKQLIAQSRTLTPPHCLIPIALPSAMSYTTHCKRKLKFIWLGHHLPLLQWCVWWWTGVSMGTHTVWSRSPRVV